MVQDNVILTPEEKWQQSEDERLEYEGYCRKIIQGLENQDEKSGIRAIWELVQNAKDQSKAAKIKIELTERSFIFSHHGTAFDYTSFRALVKQDSSKDRADADLVGQYGTGFMTTHSLNRLVRVSAPYAVKSEEGISGYVQIHDFPLDRTKVDTPEGPKLMREQLSEVKELCKKPKSPMILDDTTSFRYDLEERQVAEVSGYLESAIRLMPFVLILNDSISEVEVDDHYSKRHFVFKKNGEKTLFQLEMPGWIGADETVDISDYYNGEARSCHCRSLKSVQGDVVIIPPYPQTCGEVMAIPSLFLWFPLLGTEGFGVNFIFHSKRFYPVEKRNNIMLPGVSDISKKKGGENEQILREMMLAIFAYYADATHAKDLSIEMCQVAFPEVCDNEETQRFYYEMQELWKQEIPKWKILPIGEERLSMEDGRVRVLHPSFYNKLDETQRAQYEPVIAQYAKLVKLANGVDVLIPEEHLFAWSETVSRWHCENDKRYFLTIEEVCSNIKNKGDNLLSFLMLLRDSGNEKVMEDYPLLPNREGNLCKRGDLCYGEFMSDDVYTLVKTLMGKAAEKMVAPEYLKVCTVAEYKTSHLQDAIVLTINNWRSAILNNKTAELADDSKDALFRFCCASNLPDFTNQRGRMMRVLAEFYGKEFEIVPTIKYRDSDEEEFYKPAFNFLLDYTLSQICQKDATWVSEHKEWLLSFLTEYAPNANEDRKKKLDTYGVLPNMNNGLCLKSDLKASQNVPDEMVAIYQVVFGKDLKEEWVDEVFEDIVDLQSVYPEDVADEIEKALVADMKQDGEHKFNKVVRKIILKIGESTEWANWFGQINEKKAIYTFSMQSGRAQKSLFALMDNLNEDHLERLAKLGENGDIDELLNKMEHLRELEYWNEARFQHLHTIGKHIEEVLRESIGNDVVKAVMPETMDEVLVADDIQDGQDIIVNLKINGEWKEIFYVEVKSKWDFSVDSAHMSTRQVRMASLHPDCYALCCVDLRPYKNQDLTALSKETIIGATNVKMEIGKTLYPLMAGILEAEKKSDKEQIKISEYRSNISAEMFEKGEAFEVLLRKIEDVARGEYVG